MFYLLVSASSVVQPILASSADTTSSVLSDGQPSTVMMSGSIPAASEDGQPLASSDVERPPTTPSTLTPGEHLNSEVFDPCVVSPHPQAGERKSVKNARKRRHAAILTDTPEKQALEQEKTIIRKRGTTETRTTVSRKVGVNKANTKNKQKRRSSKKIITQPSVCPGSDEEDWFCIVCGEAYSTAHKKKDKEWIQCIVCKNWSHVACTDGDEHYMCENCESD